MLSLLSLVGRTFGVLGVVFLVGLLVLIVVVRSSVGWLSEVSVLKPLLVGVAKGHRRLLWLRRGFGPC